MVWIGGVFGEVGDGYGHAAHDDFDGVGIVVERLLDGVDDDGGECCGFLGEFEFGLWADHGCLPLLGGQCWVHQARMGVSSVGVSSGMLGYREASGAVPGWHANQLGEAHTVQAMIMMLFYS